MPFSNVPVKNPGRYLEQFVKIVQPRGGDTIGAAARQGIGSSHAQTWKSSVTGGGGQTSNTYQAAAKQNNTWKQ